MVNQLIINKIAQAIALAEGYFTPGSRPDRNNNPGDLTIDLINKSTKKDGIYIIYDSYEDGWAALDKQVALMFEGSHIYNPEMSIFEVAQHYTATEQEAWAQNVASALKVDITTKLNEIKPDDLPWRV